MVGGIQAVTLGDDEARRRVSQKTALERKAPPTFEIAVEMQERQRWVVHENVADTIDNLLRGRQPTPQVRTIDDNGKVTITRQLTAINGGASQTDRGEETFRGRNSNRNNGWRASGQMRPLVPLNAEYQNGNGSGRIEFDRLLDQSFNNSNGFERNGYHASGPNGEDLPLHDTDIDGDDLVISNIYFARITMSEEETYA